MSYSKYLVLITMFFGTLLVGAEVVIAQTTANFEMAQRFTEERMEKLVDDNGIYPRWIEDTNKFWYNYDTPNGEFWYFVNAEEASKRPLFDRKVMASKLAKIFNKPFNYQDLDLNDFEYDVNKGVFTFQVDSINFEYQLNTRTLIKKIQFKRNRKTTGKPSHPTARG